MIQITEEMLKQLTDLYNKEAQEYDYYVNCAKTETDSVKQGIFHTAYNRRRANMNTMDQIFRIIGLESNVYYREYIVREKPKRKTTLKLGDRIIYKGKPGVITEFYRSITGKPCVTVHLDEHPENYDIAAGQDEIKIEKTKEK